MKKILILLFCSIFILSGCNNNKEELTNQKIIDTVYKPILYLYSDKEIEATITLSNPEKVTVSYPEYLDSWKVKVLNDRLSIDDNDFYSLYWESSGLPEYDDRKGFVIYRDNLAEFFEEKLQLLGLNYRERQEFIIYWLPKLMANEYNFIHFVERENIDKYMSINIDPMPETFIRVYFITFPCEKSYICSEQLLTAPIRKGFTAVEWGGGFVASLKELDSK